MVYLLHRYFGRDGREEAGALLERRSGDADNPRILGAFNEQTPDWLAFFMFTYFTDRDGKFQLQRARRIRLRSARAHDAGSCSPRRRTTCSWARAGVSRVIQRTCAGDERAEDRRPAEAARRRRDRPRHDPALPQLPLQRDDRPLRRRPVEQRRDLLSLGPQGPLRGGQARRRPPASRARPTRCSRCRTAARPRGSADAQRPERGAARRLHQGLDGRRRPLEQA